MKKRNTIIYWVATCWLALGMLSTGIVQLLQLKGEVESIIQLGYPPYFVTMLGFFKILGVVVVLLPRLPLLKEWAYAGFFFSMAGAVWSHLAMLHPVGDILPPLLLLSLTLVSLYFRPDNRKPILATL